MTLRDSERFSFEVSVKKCKGNAGKVHKSAVELLQVVTDTQGRKATLSAFALSHCAAPPEPGGTCHTEIGVQ